MKIIFITSGLEPGRDGVGDYTRRLACECIQQGHLCAIVGLNDANISKTVLELQEIEGTSISVLRLPRMVPWKQRLIEARDWVNAFVPDWMSLQYVCYGYHPKGLAWGSNRILAELGGLSKFRHLMFHEIWIGEGSRPPFRHQLIGLGQRWGIRDLHRRFRPEIVTTSMPIFQRRLLHQGITAKVLPLFGNISKFSRDDDQIAGLLRSAGSRLACKPRTEFLNGVFFGGIHPDFDVTAAIRWLTNLQHQTDKPNLISIIGRAGTASEHIIKQLVQSLPDETLEVVSLGEQSEGIISKALQFANFGINTGRSEFLGKSGTFAAMREHGVPVILADGDLDSTLLQNDVPPVLQFSGKDSILELLRYKHRDNTETGTAQTAVKLINLFQQVAASN